MNFMFTTAFRSFIMKTNKQMIKFRYHYKVNPFFLKIIEVWIIKRSLHNRL